MLSVWNQLRFSALFNLNMNVERVLRLVDQSAASSTDDPVRTATLLRLSGYRVSLARQERVKVGGRICMPRS